MVLWKKESTSTTDACYIDLLSSNELGALFQASLNLISTMVKNKNERISTAYRTDGNKEFQANDWHHAMQSYNKCLRFTTEGSENISLAYANRSACFLHMEMYDKCLIDIKLAKAANYPQRLVPKLDERETTCLKMMKEEKIQCKEVNGAALSYAPNQHFPSLANVVEIQVNDEFGKHIAAKRDIDVGKILMVEDAFMHVHRAVQSNRTCCKTCLQTKKNFIPCKNCTEFMFCDVNCMESNRIHKMMCGTSIDHIPEAVGIVELTLMAVTEFPNAELLMEFVENALITRDFDMPECDTEAQAKYKMFLKLLALPEELNDAAREKITSVYRKVMEIPDVERRFQSKQAKRFLMHLIWQHFCIVQTNSMAFGTVDGESGEQHEDVWMVANSLSLFNHSCYPNALHLRQDNKVFVYTTRPVKKGEQLFIKYKTMGVPGEGGFQDTNLRESLRFQCKCSKCIPRWKQSDCTRIQLDADFIFLVQIDDSHFKNPKKRAALKKKVLKFLSKYGRLPWSIEIELIMLCFENYMAAEYTDFFDY